MVNQVIKNPEDANAPWLTKVLTNAGALENGTVVEVAVEKLEGNWSSNAFLTLKYSKNAHGECPINLFIKTASGFSASEVRYYTRDYLDVKSAPLVRCYEAAYDAEQQRYHLLLQDISASHELVLHRSANLAYAHALADGFAALHSRWWGIEKIR